MDKFRAIIAEFIRAEEIHRVACDYAYKLRSEFVNIGFEHAKAVGIDYHTFETAIWDYCWNKYIIPTSYQRHSEAQYALENMLGSEAVNGEAIAQEILQ